MCTYEGQERECWSLTHTRSTISVPCPDRSVAQSVANVVQVDKELRPEDVQKEMRIEPCCEEGVTLHVYVRATPGRSRQLTRARTVRASTLRHLRLAVNSLLSDITLIVRTIDQFDPRIYTSDGNDACMHQHQHQGRLEQGAVGPAA